MEGRTYRWEGICDRQDSHAAVNVVRPPTSQAQISLRICRFEGARTSDYWTLIATFACPKWGGNTRRGLKPGAWSETASRRVWRGEGKFRCLSPMFSNHVACYGVAVESQPVASLISRGRRGERHRSVDLIALVCSWYGEAHQPRSAPCSMRRLTQSSVWNAHTSSATTLLLVNSIYTGTNPIREIHAEGLRGGTTITVAGEIFADNTTFQ